MRGFFYTVGFLLINLTILSQEPNFTAPLNIPLILNGNFGELRSNHFHAGIDLKTKGEIGLPVFSIEDGYISRVAVASGGYGNALYVNHPSGHTSVYAHLDKFSPELADWVKKQQYKQKSFVVNLFPEKNQFSVSKGQEIAKSGNSGSSAGPHLHFEIRVTKNQHPSNPLFFDFKIKDTTKPVVENLYVYPLSSDSHVQNKIDKQVFKLVYYNNTYHLKGMQSLNFFGDIGFGIDAIDYLDGNWSKCGIYQMEYWVDNQLINSFELNELNYNKMRYLNSHIDYEEYKKSRSKIHKTFIDPGNKLDIYRQTSNNGIFSFNDGKRHKIQIILYDAYMNASEISFYAISTKAVNHPKIESTAKFNYNTDNSFEKENIKIEIPKGALYSDLNFEFKKGRIPTGAYSSLYRVHNNFIPIQKKISISIKTTGLPKELEKKALLALLNIKNGKYSSIGGNYNKGWVTAYTRTFGDICVVADTLAPTIRSLSIKNKQTLSEKNSVRFKIVDDLSGIKKYTGTIDNKWVLFEYDAKRDLLVYSFDEHIKKGRKHKLQLIVEDQKGNVNTYNAIFNY
ncbi:MAG: M23 family metallopeptidase [Prolixibacteraceae bacterium]|jgi:murein DD-endopeptidase MepM/ murein hydrolase activator NlpD|nr:M23 family metallopeptidase [Prolixibacteraceae bacterium]